MKTAFTTLGCPEWSWDHILDEASRLGYDGIEIRGLQGEMFAPNMKPFLDTEIEKTKSDLKARGLRICCFDTSCMFHDPARLDAAIAEGRATIDLAHKMEVPYIRVFGDAIPDRERKKETIAQVAQGLQVLCRYAKGKNITVLLETHGDFSPSNVVAEVVRLVESEAFGVLWDINNPYKYGDGESMSHTFEVLGPHVKHTHIKDTSGRGANEQIRLAGHGDIPIKECLTILQEHNYQGWISFEWEKKWHPSIEEPEIALPQFISYLSKLK
jgi:sugar phosphate isomerase/epimerase